ncbi:MAG: CRISPR-associated endoribonuclease Cas6 [Chloroflexota bacterium]|nr:MAG: CRISPR-associated endoribonuclease Cas6 [Chloroflexota bacterium]
MIHVPLSQFIPTKFSLARYELTLEALQLLQLSPLKGTSLRSGFGRTLKKLVCCHPRLCKKTCTLGKSCPYSYIFETAPPVNAEVLANLSEIPRPFVIQSSHDLKTTIVPGEQFVFGLTLIGTGIKYLPLFFHVFYELGKVGLGYTQGQYRLLSVETIFSNGQIKSIYNATDQSIWGVDSTMYAEAIIARAATLPTDRITLNFLTPTRLKHQGKWIEQGPPFQALIKVLLGRISSLSYFHCDERLNVDFRGLIDRAAQVQVVNCETHWEDWTRFSMRQHQEIEIGGLVGMITYEGDLRDYLPFLALGELIHVGKGAVFGNGRYQIIDPAKI